jgi:hypothetical protein
MLSQERSYEREKVRAGGRRGKKKRKIKAALWNDRCGNAVLVVAGDAEDIWLLIGRFP